MNCVIDEDGSLSLRYLQLANYAFRLNGITVTEVKNRYDECSEFEMDETEVIMIKLKSVALYS